MNGLLLSGGNSPSKELIDKELKWADVIVCADHGYDMIRGYKSSPDLIVGDFDSIKDISGLDNINIEKHDPMKNDTDTGLAFEKLLEYEPHEIHILGALGTRFDHTLANIFLLEKYIELNIDMQILDDRNRIRLLRKGIYTFNREYPYISVLSASDRVIYSTNGLRYEVNHLELVRGSTRGVSNEVSKENSTIQIHEGKAFIIESAD